MTRSRSEFIRVRGLRYHIRRWGDESKSAIILLHGWLDVSATFQLLVEPWLARWQVIAPDWRGLGYTDWAPGGYWFPDYIADLEVILEHYSPRAPVRLVGHSLGGQAASLYAGLRPQRVKQLVVLDAGLLPDTPPEAVPARFRGWLDQLRALPEPKVYPSFDDLAARIRRTHPQLPEERARFIARCWGRADGYGRITLCADPKHRLRGPNIYRAAESEAIWKEVTAPTLFLDGERSLFRKNLGDTETARRRALFRDARSDIVPGAGHMLHFDAPEETAARIAVFLEES